MSGIALAFVALFVGVLIGGFSKSTKRRERVFRRALDHHTLDEEKCFPEPEQKT